MILSEKWSVKCNLPQHLQHYCFLIPSNPWITLYTAVGQPFTAKMAVVNLDTPYFKGHATVGLVANLAADAYNYLE
jgi:hypothetical protein